MMKTSILLILGSVSAIQHRTTFRPLEGTNPWHKDAEDIKTDAEELPYKINYFVPNFGNDEEMEFLKTKHIDKAAGWKFVEKKLRPKEPKKDYFVPHFGADEDVVSTQSSIQKTEKVLKKTFTPEQDDNGVWLVPGAYTEFNGDEFRTRVEKN